MSCIECLPPADISVESLVSYQQRRRAVRGNDLLKRRWSRLHKYDVHHHDRDETHRKTLWSQMARPEFAHESPLSTVETALESTNIEKHDCNRCFQSGRVRRIGESCD